MSLPITANHLRSPYLLPEVDSPLTSISIKTPQQETFHIEKQDDLSWDFSSYRTSLQANENSIQNILEFAYLVPAQGFTNLDHIPSSIFSPNNAYCRFRLKFANKSQENITIGLYENRFFAKINNKPELYLLLDNSVAKLPLTVESWIPSYALSFNRFDVHSFSRTYLNEGKLVHLVCAENEGKQMSVSLNSADHTPYFMRRQFNKLLETTSSLTSIKWLKELPQNLTSQPPTLNIQVKLDEYDWETDERTPRTLMLDFYIPNSEGNYNFVYAQSLNPQKNFIISKQEFLQLFLPILDLPSP